MRHPVRYLTSPYKIGESGAGDECDNDVRGVAVLVLAAPLIDRCVVVWVPPPDTERMASWVGIDAVTFTRCRVSVFEHPCAERYGLCVSVIGIRHVEVEVNLLGIAVGPLWRCVAGR